MLFGNDCPPVWAPLDGPVATLDALGLSDDDLEGVRWRNAARFFGLPGVFARRRAGSARLIGTWQRPVSPYHDALLR